MSPETSGHSRRAALLLLLLLAALAGGALPPQPGDPLQMVAAAKDLQRQQGEDNLRRARVLYRLALSADAGALDLSTRIDSWIESGHVEAMLGGGESEIVAYSNALALIRRAGGSSEEASVLNDLGRALRQAGQSGAAREAYRAALAVAGAAGDTREEASALNNLGRLEYLNGDGEAAIRRYRQAVARWKEAGALGGLGVTLGNLGEAYVLLGRPEDAVDFFDQSLRVLGDRDPAAAATWTMLGWARSALGDANGALQAYRAAMNLQHRLGDVAGRAGTLDRLGTAYRNQRRFDEARGAYLEALAIAERAGNVADTLNTHVNLCELYLRWDRLDEGQRHCRQARALLTATTDVNAEAHSWFLEAQIERQRGNFASAMAKAEKALALVDGVWRTAASKALRASFLAARRSYFDLYLDLLLERHVKEPAAGWDRRAFELAERVRTRGLVDALLAARARGDGHPDPDPDRQRRLRDLIGRIESLLPSTPSGRLADAASLFQLRSLRRHRDDLLTLPVMRQELAQPLLGDAPSVLLKTQRTIDDPDTALLVYGVGERASVLWLVSPGGFETHLLPGRALLTDQVNELQRQLAQPLGASGSVQEENRVLRTLSGLLLSPVAARLRFRRLVVIADDPVSLVPFAALPTSDPDAGSGEPLLSAHEIVYIPSISALLASSTRKTRQTGAVEDVLVAADPVFRRDDPRVRSPAVEAIGEAAPANGWNRLPGSRREALAIAQLLGPRRTTLLLDFDASRDRVLQELPDHRIVHLASHGELNSSYPELSGIVLSLVDAEGRPQQGFLRVQDLDDVSMNADLVVLSGCRAARGAPLYGEGVVGFFPSLMVAGARQLVGSLWDVSDEATAELMKRFYASMLRDARSPAAALREAQLSIRAVPRWQAPHYWAGFRAEGDWR